ncbi:MAG: Ig-like domain-containing protein [Flavobacteriaceae bacterium]|nr:Ig-like domain-containing protein [Flavobacteriaceae bacterium]
MKRRYIIIPILLLFVLSFVDCAKRGRPSGGKKDSIPPVIVRSNPENYSINFDGDEIKIYFDEYIKLKDLSKELIISPPLKYQPLITPLSTGKFIKIKIKDTLKENTTYSFNFGKSIVDNNEGNAFKYYKYILSTGDYIDSLKLKGTIKDALLLKPKDLTTVMLYEVTETFNDSIIYKEKPTYITTTKDSTQTFELTNLKEGKYLLIALKEKTNDYIFQPEYDKIGFVNQLITIPTDSSYTISLFKETPEYYISKPKHEGKNHIIFGYKGAPENLEIELQSKVSFDFKKSSYRDIKTDTIHYWFKPALENDSLVFMATTAIYKDTLVTRMRDLYADTLKIKAINAGVLTPNDTLKYSANTPINSIDIEKISVMNQDSLFIPVKASINKKYNIAALEFPIKDTEYYAVKILPGAFIDFFENTNDTIVTRVRTKELSEYATLNITLNNLESYPVIVQLVNSNFKAVFEEYLTETNIANFEYIIPGDYYVRIIYDENKNKIWDTGNYLQKLQAEKVIYYPKKLEARPNWSLIETFTLD